MIKHTNIQTSGGIFTHHFIESFQQDRVAHPALKAETFTFPNYDRLSEKELEAAIAENWEDLVERWDAVEREFGVLDISALRRRWLIPLFKSLGFNLDFNRSDIVLEDDFKFPISHLGWAGTSDVNIPIHTLLYQGEETLETKVKSGRGIKAMAPHDMLQRYLNLSEDHSWGLLSDGVYLRLLRDYYHTYTRGYTEFDLQGIFSARDFASFRVLFRLLHASRFIIPEEEEQAPIDELYEDALAMGVAVGKDLRENVQKAIETMGNGFLQSTPGLLDQLKARPDGAQDLYHEILVTIYRILFLLFAEQRGMLPGRGSVYMEEFSLTAFRTLAERPKGDDPNVDLWEKLKTAFAMIEHGVDELDIFPYNGALFSLRRTPLLTPPDNQESPRCRNDALLTTIRHLTTVEKDKVLQRISFSDLSVEEIGSIYESLLEITPRISTTSMVVEDRQIPSNTFFLDLRGMGRKTTGSYYTPPSLVNELIKSALIPVMMDRLTDAVPGYESEMVEALTEEEQKLAEEALLKIKVVDPASGSGAFLIAANNTLGLELARIRSGGLFPPEKVIRHARRDVLAHCIHGVDLNPMAVELCKVSLWINAAVEDAPLNFLDHHIQCGNSLVGATPELVKAGIPNDAYNAVTGDDKDLATSLKRQNRQELAGQQSLNFKVTLIKDLEALNNWLKTSKLAESQPALAEQAFFEYQISPENWQQRLPYDLWTAAFFTPIQPGKPIPTTNDVRQALNDPESISEEQRMLAKQMAEEYKFFHWHLAFPEVFDSNRKVGFDITIGNPPWERPELQEKEFFKKYIPEIIEAKNSSKRKELIEENLNRKQFLKKLYIDELRSFEIQSKFIRYSELFPLTSSGKYNYYAIFAELSLRIVNKNGRCGLILQSGIATDLPNKNFFSAIAKNKNLISFFDFENKKKIFQNVHAMYRFCLLTLDRSRNCNLPKYAFMLQQPTDIYDSNKVIQISWDDINKFRPNTNTVPIFTNSTEAKIAEKVYSRIPVIDNQSSSQNPWGFQVTRIFNMGIKKVSQEAQMKDFFKINDYYQSGNSWQSENNIVYLPIYEAKLMHQYSHRYSTYEGLNQSEIKNGHPKAFSISDLTNIRKITIPRFWMHHKMFNSSPGEKIRKKNWLIGYRDITNANNERTMIACILPKSAPDFTLRIILSNLSAIKASELISNFNSFVFDFFARQSMTGTHLSDYIVKQIPAIPPEKFNNGIQSYITSRVLELTYTSWDLIAYAFDIWNESTNKIKNKLQIQWHENQFSNKNISQNITIPPWIPKFSNGEKLESKIPISPFIWDENRRFDFLCDLDALYGHLYNLTGSELAYILDTFPIIKRKDELNYGEYRTKSVILEKFNNLADDPMLDGACIPLEERVSVLKKPRKKPEQRTPKPEPAPSLELESKAEPENEQIVSESLDVEQSSLLSQASEEQKEEKPTTSDYTLYRCPICDKRVLGFYKDEHTREVHGGKDPGYEKLS